MSRSPFALIAGLVLGSLAIAPMSQAQWEPVSAPTPASDDPLRSRIDPLVAELLALPDQDSRYLRLLSLSSTRGEDEDWRERARSAAAVIAALKAGRVEDKAKTGDFLRAALDVDPRVRSSALRAARSGERPPAPTKAPERPAAEAANPWAAATPPPATGWGTPSPAPTPAPAPAGAPTPTPAPTTGWGSQTNVTPAPTTTTGVWGTPAPRTPSPSKPAQLEPAPAAAPAASGWGTPAPAPAPATTSVWGTPAPAAEPAPAAPATTSVWGTPAPATTPAPAAPATTSVWGTPEPAPAPAAAPATTSVWGTPEPAPAPAAPATTSVWGTPAPTPAPAAAPATTSVWGTPEPAPAPAAAPATTSVWGTPAPTSTPAPEAPATPSWGADATDTRNPWTAASSEPEAASAPADPWGASAPAPAPAANPWGSATTPAPAPATDPWGSTASPAPAPAADPWGSTASPAPAPATDPWGSTASPSPTWGDPAPAPSAPAPAPGPASDARRLRLGMFSGAVPTFLPGADGSTRFMGVARPSTWNVLDGNGTPLSPLALATLLDDTELIERITTERKLSTGLAVAGTVGGVSMLVAGALEVGGANAILTSPAVASASAKDAASDRLRGGQALLVAGALTATFSQIQSAIVRLKQSYIPSYFTGPELEALLQAYNARLRAQSGLQEQDVDTLQSSRPRPLVRPAVGIGYLGAVGRF